MANLQIRGGGSLSTGATTNWGNTHKVSIKVGQDKINKRPHTELRETRSFVNPVIAI